MKTIVIAVVLVVLVGGYVTFLWVYWKAITEFFRNPRGSK
jgi:hypothetical protein